MANEKHGFVMMIRNEWWSEFQRHNREGKQVQSYVNVGEAPPKNTSKLFFYVVKPIGELAAHAEFIERKAGDAEEVWKEHGHESVLSSLEQYRDFLKNKRKVSFIRFKNLREANKPIPLNNLLMLLGLKRLSRRGFYVDKKTADRMVALMK